MTCSSVGGSPVVGSPVVGVIGASRATADNLRDAEEVGRLLARSGCVVVCGGRTGVMEAVARGVEAEGGLVVGILPGSDPAAGNRFLSLRIATGVGEARNLAIVHSSEALCAIGQGHGTLSEIAFALKAGKRVVGLGTWDVDGVTAFDSPRAAVEALLAAVSGATAPGREAGSKGSQRT